MKEATPPTTIEELLAQADWVRGLASALLGESGDADDLVQDTWLAAIRHPPAAGRPARPWLARVMSNLARNRWRGESRRVRRESEAAKPEAQPGGDEVAQELETHRALVEALAGIDEPQRRTIVRRYFHGLSAAEIARSEGVPESTVRTRLQRGLEALRRKLDQKYGDRSAWAALLLPLARRPVVAAAGAGGMLATFGLWKIAAVLVICSCGWVVWKQVRTQRVESQTPAGTAASSPTLSGGGDVPVVAPPPADPRTAIAPAREATIVSGSKEIAEQPTWLEARAIDPAGAPIQGAELVVVDRLEEIDRSEVPSTTSDAEGRMRLEVHREDRSRHRGISGALPKNQWALEITIEAPGRTTYRGFTTLTDGATTTLGDVALGPGGSVHGRVVVPDGLRIGEGSVNLIPPDLSLEMQQRGGYEGFDKPSIARARLESDGSYALQGVPTGSFRVATSCYGARVLQSCSDPFEVEPGGSVHVPDIVLERNPNVIEGYVVAPDGSRFKSCPSYRVLNAASSGSDPWIKAHGEPDGTFSIEFPSPAVCDVYVQSTVGPFGEVLVRNVSTGTHDLRLQVPEPEWIDLIVVDERDQPLPSYSVGLAFVGGEDFETVGRPRPEGRARVLVKALPFLVHLSADGRIRRELGPFDPSHHPRDLKVTLPPLALVRGRVTSAGQPVAGAEVLVERPVKAGTLHACNGFPCRFDHDFGLPSARTDSDGGFAITLREAGTYSLLVRTADLAEAETSPTELSPETQHPPFEIALASGGRLEGRVIPASGASAEGVLVGISRSDAICRVKRVGADGRYTFDHLAAGAWSIRRCEEDYSATGGTAYRDVFGFDPSLAEFEIEDGRTTSFDLDLTRAFARVEGEMPSGLDRRRSWHVSLVPRGREAADVASQAIDASGSFRVEASVLGPHDLVFADSGENDRDQRFVAKVDLERGTNEWSSSLAIGSLEGDALPGALLEHRWSGPGGATCTTHFLADSRGHFRADRLPSGEGTIAVLRPGNGPVPRAVVVPADDVLHIDLR